MLRYSAITRMFLAIIVATVAVVAIACGGDSATPTSAPTATMPPPPTATTPAMEPTATSMMEPTATAVPDRVVSDAFRENWAGFLMDHPGYQSEWGEPKYGGIVRLSGPATPTRSQVNLGWSAFINLSFEAHNSLLMFDPWLEQSDGVFCDLCETWEVSPDGTTYTFVLRDDIQFQSEGYAKDMGAPGFGTELGCEDVKHSMEWFAAPPEGTVASTVAAGKEKMGHLDNITCPDGPQGKAVVLQFEMFRNPTTGWLASGIAIWDKEYKEWMDAEHPAIQSTGEEIGYLLDMGTGPQIPESWDPDVVLKTRTNPNYWIEGAPFVDGYEFYPILDYNTKYTSFITGKIDHAGHGSSGLTKAQVKQIQENYPDYTIHEVEYNHISQLPMNPFRAPFDQWKVRWAIHLALDRQAWIEFNKAGTLSMASHNYYLHRASSWSWPEEEFLKFPGWRADQKDEDIAEANRLLDEVFGPGERPTDTEITIWTLLSRREIGVWALDQFRESLGWELDGKFVEVGEWIQKRQEGTFVLQPDAAPMHGMGYIPDPSDGFFGAHSKTGTRPDAYVRAWKGQDEGKELQPELDRIDALIEEQDVSTDYEARLEMVRSLSKYMIEERTTGVFLGSMNTAWGTAPRLRGTHFYSLGTYSQQRLYDRWWISE